MLMGYGLRLVGTGGSVWALAMLPNGQQLVSGGGGGRLQFWDTRTGTLLQGFTEHTADVLTVAVAPEGDAVFAGGIDERVAMFRRVTPADGEPTIQSPAAPRTAESGRDITTVPFSSVAQASV